MDRHEHGAIHKPIHTSLAYGHAKAEELAGIFQGKKKGYSYNRMSNPTVTALEKKIVAMENGSNAVVFSTGMAAVSSTLLSILRSGDHVIASKFLFGNTRGLFGKLQELGIDVSYVDSTNCENIKLEIGEHTKLVFVETIANPGTQIADLAGKRVFYLL